LRFTRHAVKTVLPAVLAPHSTACDTPLQISNAPTEATRAL